MHKFLKNVVALFASMSTLWLLSLFFLFITEIIKIDYLGVSSLRINTSWSVRKSGSKLLSSMEEISLNEQWWERGADWQTD